MKTVQEPSKTNNTPKAYGRTDIRYWNNAIFNQTYTRNGVRFTVDEFAAKIQHGGRRETFPLGSPNRASAAARAKDIYFSLKSNGWDVTLAKYKPKTIAVRPVTTTIGQFLAEVKGRSTARAKTVEDYCRAFRRIVADIAGISSGAEKFDYFNGGHQRWIEKVESVPLANITPECVQDWKQSFLKRAGNDPLKQRAARISVNSLLRQAKSLFAPALIRFLTDLPRPLPFEGVAFEPRQSMRYRSTFDVKEIITLVCAGNSEKKIEPLSNEQKKIFMLAVMAGLRRNEIDKLEWAAFNWAESKLRIQPTEFFEPKSEDSMGDVDLDPEICAFFKEERGKAKSRFVIESDVLPRPGMTYSHYRCQREFAAIAKWLRKAGINSNKPLHDLRKEYGSQVCDQHGIYAASHALRHGDIAITSQHYLDKRRKVTVGLGHLVDLNQTIIPFPQTQNDKADREVLSNKTALPQGI